jgi:CBS domain-containing protein
MRVGDLMTSDVPTVGPGDRILDLARRMIEAGVKAVPVCDGDRLAGIITDWDVTRAVADGGSAESQLVRDYMTADVVNASTDAQLGEAGQLMADHRIHHLVVCDEGRFAGILHLDVEWTELGGLGAPHATFAAPI